ncbi:uncharacterized protein CLUP02_14800 [Colletotrichum lupini]|uniref:Uncharacterized protein n=1 Tax=Colletotrichum lupini TaxID=145971 RepID=A0A9Q8WN24_9PEZI|nr:uncharacterized protein CLUP02_14800 [Colletotrichum lupini]UQC89271.1 hypothetical protein CLUP02_14800 [Colletotrichum lupini]
MEPAYRQDLRMLTQFMHVDFPLTPTSLQNTIRRLPCSLFTRLLPTGGSHLTSHRKLARSGKQFSLDYPKYRLSFSSWRHTHRIRNTHAHLHDSIPTSRPNRNRIESSKPKAHLGHTDAALLPLEISLQFQVGEGGCLIVGENRGIRATFPLPLWNTHAQGSPRVYPSQLTPSKVPTKAAEPQQQSLLREPQARFVLGLWMASHVVCWPMASFCRPLRTFGARHKESYSPLPLITGGYFLE